MILYIALPGFKSLQYERQKQQYLSVGGTGTVICPGYLGNPAQQVEWYVNETKITLGDRYSTDHEGLHLLIDSTQFNDGGVYNCKITNAGSSPDIHVVVKPQNSYTAVSEGEAVNIKLPFSEEATTCVSWEIEKEEGSILVIDTTNEHYNLSNNVNALRIEHTTAEDYTTYRCHLVNDALFKITLLYSEYLSLCVEDEHNTQTIEDAVMVSLLILKQSE